MSSFFTPETPLGQAVQRLLMEEPAGLTLLQIRRTLRHQGKFIEEASLRELLAHPQVFAQLSGDRYCLRSQLHVRTAEDPPLPTSTGGPVDPLLVSFPAALDDYVVIDLETTGFDPERDQIIQLVAIRYAAGQPVAAQNYYLNPGAAPIASSLWTKLGLDRYPAVEQAIHAGPPFSEVRAEVRAFLGDLPIVAHNARFDMSFLTANLGELANPVVDTMELALLLCPALRRHQLEALIDEFGLEPETAPEVWQQASGPAPLVPIGRESLHNAITDTCLLAGVYRAMVDRWLGLDGHVYVAIDGLLPELSGRLWQGSPPDLTRLFVDRAPLLPPEANGPPVLLDEHSFRMVEEIYRQFQAARNLDERPSQSAMMRLVWRGLTEERFKMIEAPTGTGKTLAYLLPSVVHAAATGETVAISTAYRNLQDQLLAEIDAVSEHTGLPFRWQVLKGSENYICLDRLTRQVAELDASATIGERYALACIIALTLTDPDATLDDLSYWLRSTSPVARQVAAAVTAGHGACGSMHCDALGCLLPRAAAAARGSHIVVLNHALWLAEPRRLPPLRHLILDEAHTLEDVATSALTREVSGATLGRLLDALFDPATRRGLIPRLQAQRPSPDITAACRQVYAALGALRTLIPDFGRHLTRYIRSRDGQVDPRYGASSRLGADPRRIDPARWATVEQARQQLFSLHLADLSRLVQGLWLVAARVPDANEAERLAQDFETVSERLAEQFMLQEEIVRVGNRHRVYWIEVEPEPAEEADQATSSTGWALKAAPIRVDHALEERYQRLASVMLVSATLTIRGGDFSFFVDRLGLTGHLEADDLHQLPSDLNYSDQAFLGLTRYLDYTPVERTMRSFQQELAGELELLLEYTDGRALVLFTARDRMLTVYERCEPNLGKVGVPVLIQRSGASRRQLQEDFQAQPASVLFGLRSFWEGVDIPGDALSFVVMEKLPFPFLFDPVIRARREEVAQRGQHEFDAYLFPLMALQFKQGFGRLIRRRDDRGAVILMDKRIHRKTYKADLLASLPGFMPRDEQAERSRGAFYRALADRLPGVIDLERKATLLDGLPQEILPDVVQQLQRYQLPDRIPDDEYQDWRARLTGAMRDVFGFDGFRSPEQEQVIQSMLAGRDVLALLPTGAGKSLCFQLTALLRGGVTLVFSPLIALMRDQVQSMQAHGIEIVSAIYSGQPADEREETLARMRAGKVRLVYIAPERMRDPQLLAALRETQITQVVVDEAHCVAMWGPSFRPDFLYLPRLFTVIGRRPPIATFTATATPEMRREITQALGIRAHTEVTASFDRPELRFVVYNRHSRYHRIHTKRDRFQTLMTILQAADRTRDSVLIYVARVADAEILARRLRAAGHDARAYHGRMTTADRDSVQELFMDDHINIVVCTKAFGMGIDKPDIRYVIHYHMPGDLESYFQEAGRAGRDGEPAWCVLLHHRSDRNIHDYFIDSGTPDPDIVNALLTRLRVTPGDVLHLNTLELMADLDIDEVQLKIGLHLLEQAEFVERGPDFTLKASLTPRAAAAEVVACLAERDGPRAALFQRVAATLGWAAHRRIAVDLLEAADRLGLTPSAIDTLLVQLAMDDFALYRPWEKGIIVEAKQRLRRGTDYDAGAEAAEHQTTMRGKLHQMIAYAEADAGCRRATILRYFGQEPSASRCGDCDLCVPETAYPWSLITTREAPDPGVFFDPAFTLLEVVQWNHDRRDRGRNPYGAATLQKIVLGDGYAATYGESNSARRSSRLRDLRACPYWGVFETLPNAEKAVRSTLDRLEHEEFITYEIARFDHEAGKQQYRYPTLLPKGREQLLSGDILAW